MSSKKPIKGIMVKVTLLNGDGQQVQLSPRATGQDLYNFVMRKLSLIECDYFDFEFSNKDGVMCWLDHEKLLLKQSSPNKDLHFFFGVKFYSPHPNLLEDEYTRYLFALQIKKDLTLGHLQCNENTSALLAAFIVQADIGDFLEDEYVNHFYLTGLKLIKSPTDDFLIKVMDFHTTLIGQSPAEADFNLLDTARKVELYGVHMHRTKDHEGLALNLAVTHAGVLFFQNMTKINTFSWTKVRKLSFKRKKFLVKLHQEGFSYSKDTVEFHFETRNDCKNFWKLCIEHHAFFRCQAIKRGQKKGLVMSKGSSFRYTGRTQKQLMDYVRENYVKRPQFERSCSSGRTLPRSPAGAAHRFTGVTSSSAGEGGGGAGSALAAVTSGPRRSYHLLTSSAGGAGAGGTSSSAGGYYTTGGGGSGGGGGAGNSSARSRNASTSSGSHTVGSSREHLQHNGRRSMNQSPTSGGAMVARQRMTANSKAQSLPDHQLTQQEQLGPPEYYAQDGQAAANALIADLAICDNYIQQTHPPTTGGTLPLPPTSHHQYTAAAHQTLPIHHQYQQQPAGQQQTGLNINCPMAGFDLAYQSSMAGSAMHQQNLQYHSMMSQQGHPGEEYMFIYDSLPCEDSSLRQPPVGSTDPHELARSCEDQLASLTQALRETEAEIAASGEFGEALFPGYEAAVQLRQNVSYGPSSSTVMPHQDLPKLSNNIGQPPLPVPSRPPNYLESLYRLPPAPLPPHTSCDVNQTVFGPPPVVLPHQPPSYRLPSCQTTVAQEPPSVHYLTKLPTSVGPVSTPQAISASPTVPGSTAGPALHTTSSTGGAGGGGVLERPTTLLPGGGALDASHHEATIIHDDPPQAMWNRGKKNGGAGANSHYPPVLPSQSWCAASSSGGGTMSSILGGGVAGGCGAMSVLTHTLTTLSSVSGASSTRSHSDAEGDGSENERRSKKSSVSNRRRRTKNYSDRTYYLIKEILLTERTYKKDLEVLCVWLRKAVASGGGSESRMPERLSRAIFSLLDPIYDQHVRLLKDLEGRYVSLEGRSSGDQGGGLGSRGSSGELVVAAEGDDLRHKVADIFLANIKMLPLYRKYFENLEDLLTDFERTLRQSRTFESGIREFEAQKVCYLPVYVFFLKPMHRLLHYRVLLERLLRHYEDDHPDLSDCRACHSQFLDVIQASRETYRRTENLVKLLELQRDLVNVHSLPGGGAGGPGLVQPGREFIREGWLQKLSKKGYQQRMFFLFSDRLIYASRTASPFLQFKIHGQFSLRELIVEESEAAHSFTVYLGNRCFLAAASSDWQRDRWVEDMSKAILATKTMMTTSVGSTGSGSSGVGVGVLSGGDGTSHSGPAGETPTRGKTAESSEPSDANGERHQIQQRANTSLHVCWHRNVTMSMADVLKINEYQISGYLLRKFKNSNGWQKLWVVFTQLCLFFYKSCQDECPLASLPLLGYSVSSPLPEDQIRKEHVFKLQFKNHIYFFRGESLHAYERWYEVLNCATGGNSRTRAHSGRYRN